MDKQKGPNAVKCVRSFLFVHVNGKSDVKEFLSKLQF